MMCAAVISFLFLLISRDQKGNKRLKKMFESLVNFVHLSDDEQNQGKYIRIILYIIHNMCIFIQATQSERLYCALFQTPITQIYFHHFCIESTGGFSITLNGTQAKKNGEIILACKQLKRFVFFCVLKLTIRRAGIYEID